MNDVCSVTIDGSYPGTYYTSCDFVQYLQKNLVNTSNSTIYLYSQIQNSRDNTNNYIIVNPYKYPIYYRNGYSSVEITNIRNVSFSVASQFYREYKFVSLLLLTVLTIFMIFNLFKS